MSDERPLIEEIVQQLDQLVEENDKSPMFSRSRWIVGQEGKIFLRASKRLLDYELGTPEKAIDLATIDLDEEYHGQGLWSQILEVLEQHAVRHNRALFVENVLNDRIEGSLLRRNYRRRDDCEPYSYWKRANELADKPISNTRRKAKP